MTVLQGHFYVLTLDELKFEIILLKNEKVHLNT